MLLGWFCSVLIGFSIGFGMLLFGFNPLYNRFWDGFAMVL